MIAALAALAMVPVAVAAGGAGTSITSGSPKKAGTKKKPRPTHITTFIKNNVAGTTASKIEIDFPKQVKISGKGLAHCSLSQLSKPGGKANCPATSKAGTGVSHAVLGSGSSGT